MGSDPSRSRSAAQSVGARHRGPLLDCILVLECTRRFMPCQAAVVAAVGRWVARGQCALTFVEPPGCRGPAAGHNPIQHPIGRKSTPDPICSRGVYLRLGPWWVTPRMGHRPAHRPPPSSVTVDRRCGCATVIRRSARRAFERPQVHMHPSWCFSSRTLEI